MAFVKKNHGGPNVKFFQSPETISALDLVVKWLQKNCKKHFKVEPLTSEMVADLVIQLIQLQEEYLGRNASKPPLTKVPIKCFMDFAPGGGLSQILGAVLKYKSDQGWRGFDFNSTSKREHVIDLLIAVRKALVSSKMLILPDVYLMPEIDDQLKAKLKEIVNRHHGSIVDSGKVATHIVYPIIHTDPNEDYVRVVLKRNRNALLHFIYTPDSYDAWVTDMDINATPKIHHDRSGPIRVEARWLLDLEKYNEWMNEEDYEVDYMGNLLMGNRYSLDHVIGRKPDRRKRKNRSPSPERKRRKGKGHDLLSLSKNRLYLEPDDDDEEDSTKDMQNPSALPHLEEVELPVVVTNPKSSKDNEFAPPKNATVIDLDAVDTCDDPQQASSASQKQERLAKETIHIIVPSRTSWFNYSSIHPIERRSLPEFFDNSSKTKTPEIYIAWRNFMIDTYRLDPCQYLTVSTVRKHLMGEIEDIVQVHTFLEHWGLINYELDAEARFSSQSTSDFHILLDTVNGMEPFDLRKEESTTKTSYLLHLKDPIIDQTSDDSKGDHPSTSYGLKSSHLEREDFLFKMKYAATLSQEWTEEETLKLLEAMEKHGDQWEKVIEALGGKRTQDECIMRFVQLPIEDPYLEDGGTEIYQPIPFSKSPNPIMSTIAFLASVVDPRVAAAAAKAAMLELAQPKEEKYDVKNCNSHDPSSTDKNPSGLMDMKGKKFGKLLGEKDKTIREEHIRAASDAALKAASAMSSYLAAIEERKIKANIINLMDSQMSKLDIKLRHFEELEGIMDRELEAVAMVKEQILKERKELHLEQIKNQQLQARHHDAYSMSNNQLNSHSTIGGATSIGLQGSSSMNTAYQQQNQSGNYGDDMWNSNSANSLGNSISGTDSRFNHQQQQMNQMSAYGSTIQENFFRQNNGLDGSHYS